MLYFVGVGPGDPELITMKAVRILQEAAVIVLPDSGRDSVIWKIIEKWVKNKPVYSVSIPMHGMKQEWHEAHRRAAEHIRELMKEYETAAYPVLGDPGIYASGSYLMKHISAHHPCNVIPGVPAMCVAAAELGIPLCEQHEDLWVTDTFDTAKLPLKTNTVLMKSGNNISALKAAFADTEAYAIRNLGMSNQWIGRLADYPEDVSSYFTTVIVKPQEH